MQKGKKRRGQGDGVEGDIPIPFEDQPVLLVNSANTK